LSAERLEQGDWSVQPSLRFAHSAAYIGRALEDAGLAIIRMEDAVLRKDRDANVDGLLVMAQRQRQPDGIE
jgi:predicted TPR repeat methyltransferase